MQNQDSYLVLWFLLNLSVPATSLSQDDDVVTTAFKWLRAVAPEEFTGVHTDRVFLGRGSPRLLTAWIPLGDCPVEQVMTGVIPQT